MSEKARRYARPRRLTTIWDVWPCQLYYDYDEPSNSMRCIHEDEKNRTTFYENMSKAFAIKAQKAATVMHSGMNFINPPTDGIWSRIEFPTMREQGSVDVVSF
jgi:hypothetical protein